MGFCEGLGYASLDKKHAHMSHALFLDLDDTLFPSTELETTLYAQQNVMILSGDTREQLDQLDQAIDRFCHHYLLTTHFFVLTHATDEWITTVGHYMPKLQRWIQWNYIQIVRCGNEPKRQHMMSILRRDPTPYESLGVISDAAADIQGLQYALRKLHPLQPPHYRIFSLLFHAQPTIHQLTYEWQVALPLYQSFRTSTRQQSHHHCVVDSPSEGYHPRGGLGS